MFVNILTADDKHYLLNRDNLTKPIQIPLPQRANIFSEFFFFFHFQNLYSILNIFQKNMTLIADVFSEIQAPKNMVR